MPPRTVGVPRSLFFHSEAVLVCSFLESLGIVPIMSPPTDRRIMERGCALAVDETCLPMKIHLGHVDALRGRADAVLVPRYANLPVAHGEMCVKFWAAHDITSNTFPDLPLLTYNVDRQGAPALHDPPVGRRAHDRDDAERLQERAHQDSLAVEE